MKPTAPLRNKSSVFATTLCRGLSLSRLTFRTKNLDIFDVPEVKEGLREEEGRAIRILSLVYRIHASSLHSRCRFDIRRNVGGLLPSGDVNEGFRKNADVRRTCSLSGSP